MSYNISIKARAGFFSQPTTKEVKVTQENPFLWLYIPRSTEEMTLAAIKSAVRASFPVTSKFSFPKKMSAHFILFIAFGSYIDYQIKDELQWRVKQIAGAIWENGGLDNVFRQLEVGMIPTWKDGLEMFRRVSDSRREQIKKFDANQMSALLLYEFASDTTKYKQTDFTEEHAFCRELNKDGLLLREVIRRFYSDMSKEKYEEEDKYLEGCNNVYNSEFSFSPDHTGSILESMVKHIYAWKENPLFFIIGGMHATISKKEDEFIIQFANRMGLKSLSLHILKDITSGPLSTTTQTFTFKLSLEQFRKYK